MPSPNDDWGRPSNAWTRLTHVCRHWRDIALNTKALWSRITLTDRLKSPAFLAISFFTRSYPLPITLDHRSGCSSDIGRQHWDDFYVTLAQNADRISALYLRTKFFPKAMELLHISIPKLVELELNFGLIPEFSSVNDFSPQDRSVYTENFLNRHAFTLRKLSLSYYIWPQQAFTGLTHLNLTDFTVNYDLFFQMLASVSSTLQFLNLQSSGNYISEVENYGILPIEKRPVMVVLQYLEMCWVSEYFDENYMLMQLYNLFLPNAPTLIWDWGWSRYLDKYTPGPKGMAMIPPPEQLARVTSLVGWTFWSQRYLLKGTTLHFPPVARFSELAAWPTHLPNLVTLAVHGDDHRCDYDMLNLLTKFPALECLHFCSVFKWPFLMFDLEKAVTKTDFLPNLQTLIAYTHNTRPRSEEFTKQGLQPLELGEGNRMLRTRPHLDSTYALIFEKGCINGHVFHWQY